MKPRRFAEGTTVAPEKSRAEIDAFLSRQGARSFTVHNDETIFAVQFSIKSRTVRFTVERPKADPRVMFRHRETQREAEERRRWRALLLVLKAKFEAVASGITTFDREFLAHLVAGNGTTVGDALAPQLDRVLAEPGARFTLPAGPSPEPTP